MPKNPDLIPTVVVDVNGRTTIVHKLRKLFSSSAKSQGTGSNIPAPVVPSAGTTKSSVVDELVKSVSRVAGVTEKTAIKKLGNDLHENFSRSTLLFFCEIMTRDDGFSAGVAKQIAGDKFSSYYRSGNEDGLKITIRNNALFYPMLGVEDYEELHGLVRGTQNKDERLIELRDLSLLSALEVEQFATIAKATRKLRDQYPADLSDDTHPVMSYSYGQAQAWTLKNNGLTKLLQDHPDEMDEIVDAVMKYQTIDHHKIRGLLLGVNAPLAEGAL